MKPVTYEDDHDVKVTENSIKIAEELTKTKFPEPHDVEKRKAKEAAEKKAHALPTVYYREYDSDDEDPDTVETRKSLKQAENTLKARFFTNESDKKKYAQLKSKGQLRKEVAEFKDKSDNDVTLTKKEVEEKEADKARKDAAKDLKEQAEKATKKGEKEFLDEKVKKDLEAAGKKQAEEDKADTKKEEKPAEKKEEKKEEKAKPAEKAAEDNIPAELKGLLSDKKPAAAQVD